MRHHTRDASQHRPSSQPQHARRPKPSIAVRLSAAIVATTMFAVGLTSSAVAQNTTDAPAAPYSLGADGTTQAQYSYAKAIREYAYVPVTDANGKPLDTDGDGKQDFTRVDVIRPGELDQAAKDGNAGAKVASIMDPSPYYGIAGYGRGPENEYKKYTHPDDPANSTLAQFPQYYDNYFVPRGYAYVLPESPETNLSDGCSDALGPNEIASMRSVVDWLNGRVKAYKTKDVNGEEVSSYWSNGNVAAFGKSYDGGLVDGLAATGVDGLKTIIPISGIVDYYTENNPNGTLAYGGNWIQVGNGGSYDGQTDAGKCQALHDQIQDATDHGTQRNLTDWWAQRNFLPSANPGYQASVFIVHGLNDFNVWPYGIDTFWNDLKAKGIPAKMWLSQDGHDDPFDFRRDAWVATIHKWLDWNLYGIGNDIDKEPAVSVEGADGTWTDYADWPAAGTERTTWSFAKGADGNANFGALAQSSPAADAGEASFAAAQLDDTATATTDLAAANNRLLYVSEPLAEDTHISGVPEVNLRMKATKGDTNVSFLLVDYGDGSRIEPMQSLHALSFGETISCYGEASPDNQFNDVYDASVGHNQIIPGDDGCYVDNVENVVQSDRHILDRGFASTAHRDSLAEYEPAPTDAYYDMTVKGMPTDFTVPAGHRVGIVLVNNLSRLADLGDNAADITIDLAHSTLSIPVSHQQADAGSTADKSALLSAYKDAAQLGSTDYTPETWKAFDNARANANLVINDRSATQQTVDEALAQLQAAQTNLAKAATADANSATDPQTKTPYKVGPDGTTQAQYSYANAIREYAYVPVTDANGNPQDTDGDGKQDFTRVDIIRPSELDAAAKRGDAAAKVSSIMMASPYFGEWGYGRGPENEYKQYYHPDDPANSPLAQFSLYYDNYFVPRGYAYILSENPGSNLSDGCADGEGPQDVAAHRSVIDWLNGRAKAYKTKDVNGVEVPSYWSNGKVGAIGKSADGALVNGLAATGVDGLKTVVPVSGAANNYDQTSPDGVQKYGNNWIFTGTDGNATWSYPGQTDAGKCAAMNESIQSGSGYGTERSYNAWWAQRNNLPSNNPDFKASVFIVHGLNDLNVWTYSMDTYYQELKAKGLPVKMWLSQDGHDDPFDFRRDVWVNTIHRWFDHALYDVDNGIDKDPAVSVEGSDGTWTDYTDWPAPESKTVTWSFSTGGDADSAAGDSTAGAAATAGNGTLKTGEPDADAGEASFKGNANGVTDVEGDARTIALDGGGDQDILSQRLVYVSDPLTQDTHVSGLPEAKLRVKSTQGETNIAFALIDYGKGTRIDYHTGEDGLSSTDIVSCYGLATPDNQYNDVYDASLRHNQIIPGDDGCYNELKENTITADAYVIGRGVADVSHKDGNTVKVAAPVGDYYDIDIKGMMSDYTVPAGHRIGVIVLNNAWAAAVTPADFTVDLAHSTFLLPVSTAKSTDQPGASVDKSALQQAYDAGKRLSAADYTPQTWMAFENALAQANAVLSDGSATQDQVDAALKALLDAQGKLAKRPGAEDSGSGSGSGSADGGKGEGLLSSTGSAVAGIAAVVALLAGGACLMMRLRRESATVGKATTGKEEGRHAGR